MPVLIATEDLSQRALAAVYSCMATSGADESSSSDDSALSDGFEFEEDEDDVRQRAMMSGSAGGSLQDAEARVAKRRAEEMELPLPARRGPGTRHAFTQRSTQLRGRPPSCAHCGDRLCRSARTLTDAQLASAADYGLTSDFVLHFGAFRCASQVLAFAKLLHNRLCPEWLRGLAYDLLMSIALTLSCERTQLRVQQGLRYNVALGRVAPCPAPIFDDCVIVALKAEQFEAAELLIRQLGEQMTCSEFVRPNTAPRGTVHFNYVDSPISLLDLVGAMSRTSVPVLLAMWDSSPADNLWEALHWMRCLRQWCIQPLPFQGCVSYRSGFTAGALSTSNELQQREIRSIYRSLTMRFGADGVSGGVERGDSTTAVVLSEEQGKPPLLAPWVLSDWLSHPLLGGQLCPYAQLLGRCPQVDVTHFLSSDRGSWSRDYCCGLCVKQWAESGCCVDLAHCRTLDTLEGCCDVRDGVRSAPCACCNALATAQLRDCTDILDRLDGFLSLQSPTTQTSCRLWRNSSASTLLSRHVAAFN